MTSTTTKTLKKMLSDRDPVAWLVAADMMEDQGEDASALRRKAELTMVIAAAITNAHHCDYGTLNRRPIGNDGLLLQTSGGNKVMDVFACERGLRRSFIVKLRRDLLTRPDYLNRRAAELAVSVIEWKQTEWESRS